jgi:hypothetical protein
MLHFVVSYKLTNVSEMLTASIIKVIPLMKEALSTSETLVNFYDTIWRKTPEDSHVHLIYI